jgi:hypothetical protein
VAVIDCLGVDPRLVLNIASAAMGVFALPRLIRSGVHRSYPRFCVYLAAAAFVWLAGGPTSQRYVV